MNLLRLVTIEESVPILDADGKNQWTYKGFFLTPALEESNPHAGYCHLCLRKIQYNFIIQHPQYGETYVGMECVKNILSLDTTKNVMEILRHPATEITKLRYQDRLDKLVFQVPPDLLGAYIIPGTNISAKDLLDQFRAKLQEGHRLNQAEVQTLQDLERNLLE